MKAFEYYKKWLLNPKKVNYVCLSLLLPNERVKDRKVDNHLNWYENSFYVYFYCIDDYHRIYDTLTVTNFNRRYFSKKKMSCLFFSAQVQILFEPHTKTHNNSYKIHGAVSNNTFRCNNNSIKSKAMVKSFALNKNKDIRPWKML